MKGERRLSKFIYYSLSCNPKLGSRIGSEGVRGSLGNGRDYNYLNLSGKVRGNPAKSDIS